jgi:RNase P protein component
MPQNRAGNYTLYFKKITAETRRRREKHFIVFYAAGATKKTLRLRVSAVKNFF